MKPSCIVKVLALSLFLLIFLTGPGGGPLGSALAQANEPLPEDNPSPAGETDQPGEPLSTQAAGPISPCGGGGCVPAPGAWQTGAPLPIAVYAPAVASDGVYVYSAGGSRTDTNEQVNQFIRYDPFANTWTPLAPLPTPVDSALGVFAGGKVYVFGGRDSSSSVVNLVQVYTIASNTWSTSATTLPGVRQQMGGGYWNGVIYLVGGFVTNAVGSEQNQTWAYSIAGHSWSALATLPTVLAGPASGVIDGHLYIVGGRNAGSGALNTNFDFDIAANSWTARAVLPTALNVPGGAVYRGSLWVFGGGTPFSLGAEASPMEVDALNATYIYSPVFNTWATGPSQNVSRSFQGAAVVRNRIVSAGGYAGGSSNVVEVAVQNPLRILIVYADAYPPTNLQARLLLQQGVSQVDLFRADSATATYPDMWNYDLVVAYSNTPWSDAAFQGDEIATYLAQGGAVVAFNFDWGGAANALGGQWTSGGYTPFLAPGQNAFSDAALGSFTIGHPLMAGVQALNAYYRQKLVVAAGATQVASWDTVPSMPLVAVKDRAVGVSAYVGNFPTLKWSGDFPTLIVNAGYWLRTGNGSCTNLTCPKTTVINGSITDDDAVETPRLFRVNPASTCGAPKPCPGLSGTGSFHYDAHLFYNNTQAEQCVTASLDPGTCLGGTAIHASAYSAFLPTDVCSGYLADIGASPGAQSSFSFKAAANSVYMIVVNETVASSFCPAYTLKVSAGACPQSPIVNRFVPLVKK